MIISSSVSRIGFVISFSLSLSFKLTAQEVFPDFTDVTHLAPGLPNLRESFVKWGDYDNDNDLDFVISGVFDDGTQTTQIWRNGTTGSLGVFTNQTSAIAPGLPPLDDAHIEWSDFDHDNDLDLLMTGYPSEGLGLFEIWVNDVRNSGHFFPLEKKLPYLHYSYATWGDYDNDGDLDLLVCVATDIENLLTAAKLFQNTGNGDFIETSTSLPNASFYPAIEFADYDNDGDLDLAMQGVGFDAGLYSRVGQILKNDNNNFIAIDQGLKGLNGGLIDFGDYDSDGDLDLLRTGYDGDDGAAELWRNDNGVFINTEIALPPVDGVSSPQWIDLDNDGNMDIIFGGYTGHPSTSGLQIWKNIDKVFYKRKTFSAGEDGAPFSCGDFDNDHDIDIVVSADLLSKLYRNECSVPNAPPTNPTLLTSEVTEKTVKLVWSTASDDRTTSLTYNVRVGTSPDGTEIVSPQADLVTGYRFTPDRGNAEVKTNFLLKNLPPGTYYWSVQAIDNNFEGSLFAPEQTFTIEGKSTPAITFPDASVVYGTEYLILDAESTNTLSPIEYESSNPEVAEIENGKIRILKAGISTIMARQEETDDFQAASVSMQLTVAKMPITIKAENVTKVNGTTDPLLTYKITEGYLVGEDKITGALERLPGEENGSYTITLGSVDPGPNYLVNYVPGTLTIKRFHELSIPSSAYTTFGTVDFNPGANSTTVTIPIVYRSSDAEIIEIKENKWRIKKTGTVIIFAKQVEDNDHFETEVQQTLTISKGKQTISVEPIATKYITDSPFDIIATCTSELPIAFSNFNPEILSISGGRVTIHGRGSAKINVSQAGDENWEPAPEGEIIVVVENQRPILTGAFEDQVLIELSPFTFKINKDSFFDADGDELEIKATLDDGQSLPTWLVFDQENLLFHGTAPSNSIDFSIELIAKDSYGGFVKSQFRVSVVSVVGTEFETFQNLGIYPNPTTGLAYLELPTIDTFDIVILASNGETVRKIPNVDNQYVKSLDLTALSPGVYFIFLVTEKNTYVSKLIKG